MRDTKRYEPLYQENKRFFKGYKRSIEYRSRDYENIVMMKLSLSLRGYKSHPIFFDIMVKDGINYFISTKNEIDTLINLQVSNIYI